MFSLKHFSLKNSKSEREQSEEKLQGKISCFLRERGEIFNYFNVQNTKPIINYGKNYDFSIKK